MSKKRLCTKRKKTLHFFKIVAMVQGVFAEKWCEISPFLLFLDKKQLKKDYVVGGKNVTFFQNYPSGTGSFCWKLVWNLTFCSFFREKTAKKRLYTKRKKTLHFFKLVALVQGVFAENWSEISPFVLFLDKKQLKKDCILGGKNVSFFQNCASGTGGFCWKMVWNLTFSSFFGQKTTKKRLCTRRKKNVTFFQNYRSGTGVFCWKLV